MSFFSEEMALNIDKDVCSAAHDCAMQQITEDENVKEFVVSTLREVGDKMLQCEDACVETNTCSHRT